MRKPLIAIAFLLISGLTITEQSCNVSDAIKNLFDAFTWNSSQISYTIPIITSTTTHTESDTAVINVDQIIKDNTGSNLSISDISAIYIDKIVLQINNTDATNNWTNFESISTKVNTSKGLTNSKADLNQTYSIADDAANQNTDITLNSFNGINLIDYLDGGNTSVYTSISAKARRATTAPLTITATVTYSFKP